MSVLLYIIIASFLITCCVWFAILFLYFRKETLEKITLFLISLSAGVLMGGAFIHLLPEASLKMSIDKLFLITLIGFIFFFFMEKVLHWRHCHKGHCEIHTFGYINLFGDALHNFVDGLVIAGAFLINVKLGVATTMAIAMHEIPQEIGDFGVLIHAGFKKKKALIINYLVALTVVLGGILGYFLSFYLENIIPYLLPFAAGGFIYISASDLMPEIRKETKLSRSISSFMIFVLGLVIMYLVRLIN